ncbi:TPA: hypothetical protein TYI14_000628 [Streptococcus suis]|nr:hypothetical protein [Streptococcus suis]
MKTIRFICPYFGNLPKDILPFWIQSCKYNPSIEWYIFTDDESINLFELPPNITVIKMTLDDYLELSKKLFDFPIKIENGYKLCDYKPLFGAVFDEWLDGIDFWGHCDISDTLYGDLRKFLTDEVLSNADKIMFLGHMTLYRNTVTVNNRYKIKTTSNITLEEIFSSSENFAFDELKSYSINKIYIEQGFPMKRLDDAYVDVSPLYFRFRSSKYDEKFNHLGYDNTKRIFLWESGKLFELYLIGKSVSRREIGYIHFQKRKLKNVDAEFDKNYYITPKGFMNSDNVLNVRKLIKDSNRRYIPYYPYFKQKIRSAKYRLRLFIQNWRSKKG